MIQTAEWMSHAVEQSTSFAYAYVRMGQGWNHQRCQEQDEHTK